MDHEGKGKCKTKLQLLGKKACRILDLGLGKEFIDLAPE